MIANMKVIATLTIPAQLAYLAQVRRFVMNAAATLPCDGEQIDDLILATDEAVTNIIVHGYQGNEGEIRLTLGQRSGACVVELQDNAPTFDPNGVPKPDISAPLETRPLGGLGVHLMRILMDELHYQQEADGSNKLILVKRFTTQQPPA